MPVFRPQFRRDPLPAADWINPGLPVPAGSRPWDGPIAAGGGAGW